MSENHIYTSLIGNSYIYKNEKIFINKIEKSTKFYKIHIPGDLITIPVNEMESNFVSQLESKFDNDTVGDFYKTKPLIVTPAFKPITNYTPTQKNTSPMTPENTTPTTSQNTEVIIPTIENKNTLLTFAFTGIDKVTAALESSLDRVVNAKSTIELEQEVERAKGVSLIAKEITAIANTKTEAIKIITGI